MRGHRGPLGVAIVAALLVAAGVIAVMAAPPSEGSKFSIDISQAQPRQVEDATQQAIVRDYSKAWQNMAKALEENRAELLNASFVGIARDELAQAIKDQKQTGLKRKYLDRGHKLEVLFYSYEGSALQIRDTAQVELQVMDGGKVLHSDQKTVRYVVLLTPTENAWKVRILEAQP